MNNIYTWLSIHIIIKAFVHIIKQWFMYVKPVNNKQEK